MHVLDIQDALVEFLQDALKDYLLPSKEGIEKAPKVYDGYLPSKKNERRGEDDSEQDYPFIIVRYIGDEDELSKQNTVIFKILIGTYNNDEQHGWRDTVGLMIRIKTKLKEQQTFGSANLTGTIGSALFENQRKPLWRGLMEVEFEMPQIQRKWSGFEDEYYRNSNEEGNTAGY